MLLYLLTYIGVLTNGLTLVITGEFCQLCDNLVRLGLVWWHLRVKTQQHVTLQKRWESTFLCVWTETWQQFSVISCF